MTRENLEDLILRRYGIRADYPFDEDFKTGVFRHESGKWFALAMNISEKNLEKAEICKQMLSILSVRPRLSSHLSELSLAFIERII